MVWAFFVVSSSAPRFHPVGCEQSRVSASPVATLDSYTQEDSDETRAAQGEIMNAVGMVN